MSDSRTCPQCGRTYGGDDRFCTVDGAALVGVGGASLIGTVVADRFLVQQKLGEGGMGEVYLAEHVRMKRKVALKLMRPWMLGDPVAVGRFHREAENASQISHPNVAQVYDFGETSERVVYLAMEFVDGEPLSRILEREGRLHTVRAAEIARQTGEALTAAHAMGILHRDLKPDNVMVGRARNGTDFIKLVDFGIARAMHRGTQQFTSTGLVVGTPDYMSPEQLAGDELDARSDLYALALMAFRMLTGVGAYPEGASGESMIARLTSVPKRLTVVRPDVNWPPSLQAAFDRALAPDPRDRYADAMEFVAELDAAVSETPLGEEEQAYLVALSQRSPTPSRAGAILTPTRAGSIATPSHPGSAVQSDTPTPISAVLTPPARPRVVTEPFAPLPTLQAPVPEPELEPTVESPEPEPTAGEPVAAPAEALAVAGARRWLPMTVAVVTVLAIAAVLVMRRGEPELPSTPTVSAVRGDSVSVPATLVPAPPESTAVPTTGAGVDSLMLATVRRATVALWSSAGRGAAVIADSTGIALTAASLVPADSAVDVFLDANTRVRATVLSVDRQTGLATLLLPMRRCTRCAALAPDAADPVVGDSVVILPATGRGDGEVSDAAIAAFDGRTLTASASPRSALGAPVVSRRTQRLVALGGRKLVTPTALRDAVVAGRALARGVTPSETIVPIWPDRAVRPALLGDDAVARVKSEIERYRVTQGDLTLLLMTPQVMKYRSDQNANPLIIPADPIRAWAPFQSYVDERRAVVAINVALAAASFPTWPTRDVNFRRGDVRSLRLLRNDSLVAPIESATFPALTSNGRQAILTSAIAVYSALEFRTGDTFKVEAVDARAGSTVTFAIPAGALEVIRSDFAWLFTR